ncbi:NUDIX hydrolase [Clostridium paridis]|uniref:NUDIX hydrolase n=1 Tax=Clostridium paridis TaxID=2803863 RepID=A0A937K5U0_9CLOT|nr:NUDIX hydrolase [Clostridium paridis]MBL4932760.1 NUDIX hydrolase [Clostridium paridis]
MNKLVYLFELDSVRKTDKQIYKGQLAMFDELLGNGNIIVMSMNQITDSKAFLCMLESDEHYNIVKKLIKQGYIRISRYGGTRTVSQYIQNAINKNLDKSDDIFIFSAIPVKSNQKLLLKLMQNVLTNTDLSIIQEYIDLGDEDNQKIVELFNEYSIDGTIKENTININKAKEYLEFLYRFLELTIIASMYGDSITPLIKYSEIYIEKSFFTIMEKIVDFNCNKSEYPLWDETIITLREIKNQLIVNAGSEKNNRSVWIKKIKELDGKKKKENLYYAELIVNLCYNYTVELSIYGVSKHYERDDDINIDSFEREFFSRLKYEWNGGEEAVSRFLQEETNEYVQYKGKYPDWKRGMRIISRRKHIKINFNDYKKIPLYEYSYESQRKNEKRKDAGNISKVLITIFINALVLYFLDNKISYLQEYISTFLKSVLTFFAIAVLNDIISKLFNLPNILECIQVVEKSMIDLFAIIFRKTDTYINYDNFNNDHVEEIPNILRQADTKSKALQEYIELWKNRPDMFKEYINMIIIEPNKNGIKEIIKYETIFNKNIGVVYKSDYNMMVVDLIRNIEGKYSTYERLMPTVREGAVVVVPVYKGKFILLNQFRHAIRQKQLAFPRGYGDMDKNGNEIDTENNAIKEIKEELEAEIIDKPQKLGSIIADSGISANKVMVYTVNIAKYKEKFGYEGIENIQLKTEEELIYSIKNGEINDGYTLAAYMLYINKLK